MKKLLLAALIVTLVLMSGCGDNGKSQQGIIPGPAFTIDKTDKIPIETIKSLVLNVMRTNLTVIRGADTRNIIYHIYGTSNDVGLASRITVKKTQSTLSVEIFDEDKIFAANAFWRANIHLDVELPPVAFDDVTYNSASGGATISGLQCSSLTVTSKSGNLILKDIQADNILARTNTGFIQMDRFCGVARLATETGNQYLYNELLTDDLTLSATSGNISLKLKNPPEEAGFDLKTATGEIKANWQINTNIADTIGQSLHLSGTPKLVISTTSGTITLQ